HRALVAAEVDLDALARDPGLPLLHPLDEFLLGHWLACSFVNRTSGPLLALQGTPICAAMGYETSLQLFIDGVWKSGEGRDAHTVLNPVDARAIAEVPYATKADLDEALAASERAWPEWRSTDVEKR